MFLLKYNIYSYQSKHTSKKRILGNAKGYIKINKEKGTRNYFFQYRLDLVSGDAMKKSNLFNISDQKY